MLTQNFVLRALRRSITTLAASAALSASVLVLINTAAASASTSVATAPAEPTGSAITTTEVLAAQKALAYLTQTQNADGSITFFTTPGSAGAIGDVAESIYAARALGIAPGQIITAGRSLLAPLYSISATDYISGKVDRMGRLAIAIAAADLDPRNFDGRDFVVSMTQFYSPTTGAFGLTNWDQALAMLGWKAAGESIPITATQLLASRVVSSGGFGYFPGDAADTNSTGLVLQALVAGGQSITSTPVLSAVSYLKAAQVADGGWGYDATATDSDANSTAYVLQGLIAVGQDPFSPTWQISGTNPISFLLGEQQSDGGFVYLAPPSSSYATVQAIPALMGRPLLFTSRAVALRKGLAYLRTQQQADGGFGGFSAGDTIDAMNAIVAAGSNLNSFVSISNATPISYLAAQTNYPGSSAAAAGKYLVGVVLAGADPTNFGGLNVVVSVTNSFSPTTGRYGSSVWDQSYAILSLAAAGEPISPTQVQNLIDLAAPDGGYDFSPNAAAGAADSTGLVLMALRAAGVPATDPAVQRAIAFLRQAQLADGGYGFGSPSDANTTGLAVQGLAAYGEPFGSLAYGQVVTDGTRSRLIVRTPAEVLLNLQMADGSFFSPYSVQAATYAALPAVAAQILPQHQPFTIRVYLPIVIR